MRRRFASWELEVAAPGRGELSASELGVLSVSDRGVLSGFAASTSKRKESHVDAGISPRRGTMSTGLALSL